jgi:tRNA A37 threonylcarbamoyladenosine dehydratase
MGAGAKADPSRIQMSDISITIGNLKMVNPSLFYEFA